MVFGRQCGIGFILFKSVHGDLCAAATVLRARHNRQLKSSLNSAVCTEQQSSVQAHTMSAYSEYIDDSMYSVEWREISTCGPCASAECRCGGSGFCKFAIFNHYMYRADGQSAETDQFDFPLYISNDAAEEVCVEEVRCRRYTVGAAYDYYISKVLLDPLNETVVSVFLGEHKSTCFNMSCFILETTGTATPSGCICFSGGEGGSASILARGYEASASLLEAMCMLGIDPVVQHTGNYSLKIVDGEEKEQTLNVCASGFRNTGGSKLNILDPAEPVPSYAVLNSEVCGVRAVRTALVTVSVVLTPKSLYGGKNPTTKSVSYFVHNVKIQ